MLGTRCVRGHVADLPLVRLDGAGQITGAEWVDATDDEGARRHARQECGSIGYELWQRDRLVVRETARAD